LLQDGFVQPVVVKSVPPGNYVFSGTTTITNHTGSALVGECVLGDPGGLPNAPISEATIPANGGQETVTAEGAATITGSSNMNLTLECAADDPDGPTGDLSATASALNAIQVGSLN